MMLSVNYCSAGEAENFLRPLEDIFPAFSEWLSSKLLECVPDGPALLLTARDRDVLLGLTILTPATGKINTFYVAPENRRRGVGSTLLKTLQSFSSAPLLVGVPESDAASELINFFTKRGFHPLEWEKDYYGPRMGRLILSSHSRLAI